jgi:hypothetical protein
MFNLDKIRELSTSADPKTFDNTNIFLASVGSLVFASIAMGMMLAILFMLIARMVVLWVLIVLSPLAFVLSVLPQTEEYANQWWSEFTANVITGPVLLFFIWLAFVTAGNGKVHDEIAGGSVINTADADSILGDQASGVGAAWDWNNMANFAIAIGMLMVGARAASQLGGVGGEWAGEAVDFGKKVGMYASGAMAARWAVTEAVPYAAKKMPFIGGEAWERRGKEIVARASLLKGKFDEGRNEAVKKLEEPSGKITELQKKLRRGLITQEEYEKEVNKRGPDKKAMAALEKRRERGELSEEEFANYDKTMEKLAKSGDLELGTATGRFARRALANLLEPTGRKDKKVEDWEKAAEMQHEIVEETYSTSKLAGGMAKLEIGVREHQIMLQSEAKKNQKYALEEKQLLDSHDPTFHAREGVIFKAQAEAEYVKREIDKANEIAVAKAKDANLVKQGELPRFEAATRASHQKELEDQTSALNFRESSQRSEIYASKIEEAKEKARAKGVDVERVIKEGNVDDMSAPLDERKFLAEWKKLTSAASASLVSSLKRGSETGLQALNKGAAKVGFTEEVKAGDFAAMQRKVMSVIMGKKVDNQEEALKDYEKQHGYEQTQVLLRSLDEALKASGKDGAPNLTGLLDDTKVLSKDEGDAKAGSIVYKFETNAGSAKANRDYWAATVMAPKIITLADIVTNTNGTITNNANSIDDQSKSNFAAVFRSITRTTKLDSRLVKEWKSLANEVKEKLLATIVNPETQKTLREKLEGVQVNAPRTPANRPAGNPPDEEDDEEDNP